MSNQADKTMDNKTTKTPFAVPSPVAGGLLAAALLFLAGCITVSESVLVRGLPPVPMEEVTVYFVGEDIPPHTRVAVLSGEGNNEFTTRGAMLDRLRERAGMLGANAVILGENEEPSGGEILATAALHGVASGSRYREAIAILIEQ